MLLLQNIQFRVVIIVAITAFPTMFNYLAIVVIPIFFQKLL